MKRFCLLLVAASALQAAPSPIVLEDVLLIDGSGGKPKAHQSILLEDGKIIRIVSAPHMSDAPAGAQVIQLSGKTVMPGIINGHGHLGLTKGAVTSPDNFTEENIASQLSQYERYGVTTIMSLGMNKDLLYRIRARQESGQIGGATIMTADHGIGTPGGAPKLNVEPGRVYRPETASEARQDVREMVARKPDLIKIWVDDNMHTLPEPKPAVYGAAIEEAHKDGMRVAAHVFYQSDATTLLADKVDILAHSIRDEPVNKQTIHTLKLQKVYYIPTLELEEAFFVFSEKPNWMNGDFFKEAVSPDVLALKPLDDRTMAAHKVALAMAMRNLKRLHNSHVMVAFGTDSGATPQRVQGFDEHRELELMVQAGLKPLQAIHSATEVTAQMLGIAGKTGSVAEGKQADLLVLDADPSKNISNTQKIHMVIHHGEIVKTGHE